LTIKLRILMVPRQILPHATDSTYKYHPVPEYRASHLPVVFLLRQKHAVPPMSECLERRWHKTCPRADTRCLV